MTSMGDDPLLSALIEQLRGMRAAERDIFGAPDPGGSAIRQLVRTGWAPAR